MSFTWVLFVYKYIGLLPHNSDKLSGKIPTDNITLQHVSQDVLEIHGLNRGSEHPQQPPEVADFFVAVTVPRWLSESIDYPPSSRHDSGCWRSPEFHRHLSLFSQALLVSAFVHHWITTRGKHYLIRASRVACLFKLIPIHLQSDPMNLDSSPTWLDWANSYESTQTVS